MSKWYIVLCIFLVSACSGRIDLSDVATTGGAVAGATVAAAAGAGVPVTTALTTLGGVGAAAVVKDRTEQTIGDVCSVVPDDKKADCVKDQTILRMIKKWGLYVIYGVAGFFVLSFLVGYFIPNGQHRKLKRKMFDDPTVKMTDM